MPSLPPFDGITAMLPEGDSLFSGRGQALLRKAVEQRLADVSGVWRMRLLARDLIALLAPAMERVLRDAGLPVFSRRVRAVRITRGVREHGSCSIPRGNDAECRLAFSGHLFFPGNAPVLIDIVAHELLHAHLAAGEGHGEAFHRGMRLVNDALGLHIVVHSEKTAIRQSEGLYRYKVVCAACGNTFYYLRAGAVVKRPSRYRCARCGQGALKVYTREATDKDGGFFKK